MSYETEIEAFKSVIHDSGKAINERIKSLENRLEGAIIDISQQLDGRTMAGSMGVSKATGFAAEAAKAVGENLEQLNRHSNLRLEVKAAGDLIGTAQVGNTMNIGMGGVNAAPVGLQYAIPVVQRIGVSSIEYSRYTATEGAVALQAAEGDTKASVRGNWLLVNQPSATLAGISLVSRQAIHDNQMLQSAINGVLNRSLNTAVDSFIWNGAVGTFDGLSALCDVHASDTFAELPDAISEGIAEVQTAGGNPSAVVMHPSTWVAVVTARGTSNDAYLSGNYLGNAPMSLRGLPVTLSLSVPLHKAVLIDGSALEIAVTQQPVLEVGYSADDFVKNQARMLLETRIAVAVKAHYAATLVVPDGVSI